MLRFGTGKHMAFNVDAKYLTVPSIHYSPNPFYLNHGHGFQVNTKKFSLYSLSYKQGTVPAHPSKNSISCHLEDI
jgi:hypothetical protein